MVIGRVRCDGFGTKITGRAGSDLNGIALFVVLSVLLIFLLYKMIEVGQATTGAILMILGVTIIGLPLILWINHKDRRQADPLVRYIERAVGAKGSTSAVRQLVDQWTLSLSGKQIEGQPTPTKIAQALESLSSGDFVILAKEDEWYIQARMAEGGWSWKSGRGAQVTIIERQPVADFSARFSLKRP